MAGAGYRTFTAGAVLTAAQVQTYLQDQAVQVHASAAARSSALGTAVSAGMMSYRADGTVLEFYNGSAWTALGTGSGDVTTSGTQTLTNKTLTSPVLNGSTLETITQGSAFAGYTFYVTTNGAIQFLGSNATANGAVNITSTSGQTLNTLMATNQSITVTLVVQNGATAYYPTSVTVDGSAPAVLRWQGGAAPTAGNANAYDIYTFTLIKLGSPSWVILASQTKFA